MGQRLIISKIENLKLSNGLSLYDVMVIPEYCVTLISVHKLAKENKHDWHCRLGHLAEPVMNVLKNSLQIPNDNERVANDLNKGKSDSSSSSVFGSNINIADFPVDSENDADSSDEFVATQNEEVATLEENVFFEGNLDKNPSSSQGVQNVRRSSRQSVFLRNYNDFVVEPKVKYASKYPHWTDAMNQEMDTLLRNGTWEIVQLPEGRKAIGSKWIYKIKFRSSGEIDRYKARLVAQGFRQKEGIYYDETFSPVVKMAPRQWNAKLTSTLIENDFSQSKSDYSLYTKSDKGVFLALLVYMDDIIITGNSISESEKFKVYLKSKFMIKDLGKLKYFLGIEVVDTDKAFQILRYLKGCPDLGIHIVKESGMSLTAFSDADWAKCKQKTLSKSSTKAEYRAFASVTSEVIWVLKILKDLNIENLLPVKLHCDSNSAIKIATNHVFHEITKHLEIDLHFVREKILKGVVETVKVDSANQIADILTKGLDTF
ncbi:ribonuclease H-like domain-containing protein [Tanacetum coccineum]